MNVPNIGQGPGSVAAPPRTTGSGDAATPARANASSGASQNNSSQVDVSFARLAWFDVNGDGNIDPRSASAGGDATLLVPAHAVDLPTYPRAVSSVARALSGNVAQTHRAAVAYQRYGQPAPAASTAAPAPTPAPAPAAVPVVAPVEPAATAATPSAVADLTSAVTAAPARAVA